MIKNIIKMNHAPQSSNDSQPCGKMLMKFVALTCIHPNHDHNRIMKARLKGMAKPKQL